MSFIQRAIKGPRLPANQSNSAYAWLGMLVFFVWKYLDGNGSRLEIAVALISLLIFLLLYFASFWIQGRMSYLLIASICAIGLIWAPFNPGASVFIVFSAASCAAIQSNKSAYTSLACILASVVLAVVALKLPADFWVPALVVSGAIGVATIMQSTVRRSQEKLIRSQEAVAHLATIAERERISRDLHDLLGHTLSLITIKAELAGKLIGRDVQACQQEIADIEKTARNALSEVRAAVSGYRAVGITHELAHAASCLTAADIRLTTQVDEVRLSAAAENILSLALREAVTNVARHSKAKNCSIRLASEGKWIVLTIEDNGDGLSDPNSLKPGNGLNGMRERVSAIGGQIVMASLPGLSLQIRLPKNQTTQQGVVS